MDVIAKFELEPIRFNSKRKRKRMKEEEENYFQPGHYHFCETYMLGVLPVSNTPARPHILNGRKPVSPKPLNAPNTNKRPPKKELVPPLREAPIFLGWCQNKSKSKKLELTNSSPQKLSVKFVK